MTRFAPCASRARVRPAGTGADFEDGRLVQRSGGAGDPAGQVEIEQEVLAERFFRREIVFGDHFAQRGEGVVHLLARAIRPASSTASVRLVALARPVPASAKAVPWSGDVRMKGRPRVTLTPLSKASVLTGISA